LNLAIVEQLTLEYFESLDELEQELAKRCCFLQEEMRSEIQNLTNYHWLNYA